MLSPKQILAQEAVIRVNDGTENNFHETFSNKESHYVVSHGHLSKLGEVSEKQQQQQRYCMFTAFIIRYLGNRVG